jgi:peptidoglycan lytic transglycosylase G
MTIRRGGRPRGLRSQAHPLEPDRPTPESRGPAKPESSAKSPARPKREPVRHPWEGTESPRPQPLTREIRIERRSNGHHGPLRFLAFAFVLGGLVLVLAVALSLTVLRPLARGAIVDWAWQNQGALKIGVVADLVKEDLGTALTEPASTDASQVEFEVQAGDTPEDLAPRLVQAGVLRSEQAFLFVATQDGLGAKLNAGLYLLARNMTPEQLVTGLVANRIETRVVEVNFREGLRLEQVTAKLQTLETGVDAAAFYDLVRNPPAPLLADYDWLALPEGRSLEGYLYPATYRLVTDSGGGPTPVTDAETLVRMMLDAFREQVGANRMKVPEARGMDFYQVLTLASIVEREAVLDDERPVIAGVYQNRIDRKPAVPHGLLQADPTILYAWDATQLGEYSNDWQQYRFWDPRNVPDGPYRDLPLPDGLAGYNTYAVRGLPPGPICTPSVASIEAALDPDAQAGFAFFVAIPEGDGQHDFSKTSREHQRKLVEYGYR